ncbi:MAG: efflux RND transporter periplasmic adaptor subunit [Pyrinomonadaceae bacterium]|nr:efflux RND transporter periplasmic adaptor subunit [Acidobacteriota bacterium]MBP9110179.1 efflux RND transporter periplasmic adaptor subunit [Pyrinomonadaceae bacterium]
MMRSRTFNFTALTLLLTAAVGLVGCGSRGANTNANTAAAPTTIDVATTQAIVKQIPTYFEATGNLAGDAQTDVAPVVGGKVVEVNFDVGSYVTKGSVLVRMDDRDAKIRLETAQAQVEQQKKAVGTAIAALRQAQIRLNVKDGETFDIETFSQVKSTKANLVLADKELTRAEKLFATGDVSKATVDQRRAQRDALLGQLDESRSNAAVAVKAINSAEAQVAAARSGVATAETQVDQARKALSDTVILAPISGYVSERVADLGEFLTPNAPNTKVATIVRTSTLRLKIDVPEASIGKVAVGQGISMQTSAYPDRNFAGTVVRILPNLNTTARTLIVEAEVANGEGLLKPGQFATVRVTQSKPENAVMIPASAIRTEGDINKVYVVKDGAVRERLVQTGLLENDLIQIKTGIAEGEVIATSNLNELFDGVFVRQTN